MVYAFMNYDHFNSKYNDILKIAACYSENFRLINNSNYI